ncbi:YceI family protein [Tunicatimonas pelagia]|uniref:YceI family protein n=1 Tax=Tunicatimonas pelagia TaxID=931531 RepID=UPI002666ED51|nr:YceI family protein [Tunicatimonas pelagia]WKN41511.1 YceI family protein [Tunicatimonas pelagia]
MKKISLNALVLTVLAVVASAFTLPEKEAVTYTVDVQQSEVTWKGEKVTGNHVGTIQLQQGSLALEDGKLIGGNFTIDMSTLSNTDLEGEQKGKLEGHLKSDDFFGVATHPTATLTITKVKPQANNTYQVTGKLTIKDKTNQIQFPATVTTEGSQVTANASIAVDRSEYDVRYGSDSFFDNLGDKVIYDDFHLEVSLVANAPMMEKAMK